MTRTTMTMTSCAPYAKMKLQRSQMRLSFVTSAGKVLQRTPLLAWSENILYKLYCAVVTSVDI